MTEMIMHFLTTHLELSIIGAITLVQIVPIKLNPWSKIGNWVRIMVFGSVEKKIDSISKKVSAMESKMEEEKAVQARNHILRFADELYNGDHHSLEYFLQVLDDIKFYTGYCEAHTDFPNGRTLTACQKIKETYDSLWQNHKF